MSVTDLIKLEPIGVVKTEAIGKEVRAKKSISRLILHEHLTPALDGLQDFSHMFVVFWMHKISREHRETLRVHPRGRTDLPLLGIFATRTPLRPNPVGITLVEILKVEDNTVTVQGLDAFDGTPILDLKPFDSWDTVRAARIPEWRRRLDKE
ncbi:MAG: tRNA (N6-threonylcarbamoyladenosine(37)-N6)-methyltransferase TrmO [Candidatus Bathyarchaeota archaeon]|nr:MAG: tRNA (N6-threonylcarbamoyladenosine(37)-N6)-methyltransferase TrmO [Candidatus Bathyarchaeota archaeon]